jgi:hypothetical protein
MTPSRGHGGTNQSQCPRCGRLQPDGDGLGVIYCPACGYCVHAALYGDVCEYCGQVDTTQMEINKIRNQLTRSMEMGI